MLGLTRATDARWVERALGDLESVLVDHAHCEMKAASNALSLATRGGASFPEVVRPLVELAHEELAHFGRVLGELERRGIPLGNPPEDDYAALLRKATTTTVPISPLRAMPGAWLLERLLVGALIEARSCERFRLLADALAARGDATELASFYEELFEVEARHYAMLVDLAKRVAKDEDAVRLRLEALAAMEGEIAATLGDRPAIHG